ncbi:oligoribonuclease (plasmid) [Citricoccus nitrophenolicus]
MNTTPTETELQFGTEPLAHPDNILWMDVESNGLADMDGFAPLELAAIITDKDFNELAVLAPVLFDASEEVLSAMVPFVVNMHTKTGLLNRLATEKVHSYAEVDRILSEFIAPYFPAKGSIVDGVKYRGTVLGGNSPAGVDLPVLRGFLPTTSAQCDYRTLDVSAVGEFIKRVNRRAFDEMPVKTSDHTALHDIKECLREVRYYRDSAVTPF